MNSLHFTIDAHASKQNVWNVMLDNSTYREWTAAFHPGSYFEGSWEKGDKILFLVPDKDNNVSGMVSRVIENILYKYLSVEHVGEVIKGKEITTSVRAKAWAGIRENYSFSENDGVTTLQVGIDNDGKNKEMVEIFEQMWPQALDKLKEIAERP